MQSFLFSINKNQRKALIFINAGIFLSIFAVSAAIVSFVIEKKISKKQEELTYLQIQSSDNAQLMSFFENEINKIEQAISVEEDDRVKTEYLFNTKLNSRTISANDYYGPFIYSMVIDFNGIKKYFEKEGYDAFDINDPINQALIKMIEESWTSEEVKEFKNSIQEIEKYANQLDSIDINDYHYKEIPNVKKLINEIKSNEILNEVVYDDYFVSLRFLFAARIWAKQFLKLFKGSFAYDKDNINILKQDIISLSNLEKKIILITFVLQFFIFIIIQIFEINSFVTHLKKKIL